MVAVVMSFGLIVYGVTQRAKPGDQDEALVVKNWKGEYIGSVRRVLLDSSSGNLTLMILSLGKGQKEIVLPLSAFSSYNHKKRTLILGVSKEALITAPEFRDSDLRDPAFLGRMHRFFGKPPSWTERPGERENRM